MNLTSYELRTVIELGCPEHHSMAMVMECQAAFTTSGLRLVRYNDE